MQKAISIFSFAFVSLAFLHADEDLWNSNDPHVRIKKNDQDGSYVVFERCPDDRSLVKTTKNQNGEIKMRATYTRNKKGLLTYGQIHDGQGTMVYRVQYGYDPETGRLIAEQMFDARVKRYYPLYYTDPETGKRIKNVNPKTGERIEMPVRRVYYIYDAEGNQARAISLVPHGSKKAEDVFRRTGKVLSLYGDEPGFDPETQSTRPSSPFEADQQNKQ